jgi:hypothetical protein
MPFAGSQTSADASPDESVMMRTRPSWSVAASAKPRGIVILPAETSSLRYDHGGSG